jgi:hypothetical protein
MIVIGESPALPDALSNQIIDKHASVRPSKLASARIQGFRAGSKVSP